MPKFLTLLLLSCMLLLLQSCDLYDMGKKDSRISLPEPMQRGLTVASDKAFGQDGSGEYVSLPKGLEVSPVTNIILDDGKCTLFNTANGDRLVIHTYMLSNDLFAFPSDKLLNIAYRHYDATPIAQLEGTTIDSIVDRWGEWVFCSPDTEIEGHIYTYPQIMLLRDGRYYRGVRLHVGPDGVIRSVEPRQGVQRNLFGSLPFYEGILSMNLMEWLMPGAWLDEGRETPSRGIFFSIVNSLGIYLIVVIVLSAIFVPIYMLIDRLIPNVRGFVGGVFAAFIIAVEYICMISLLDYYSAAWWLTIIFLLGWSVIPFGIMISVARNYCPKCKGYKWWEETEISGVEMPKLKFKKIWFGGKPDVEPDRQSFMKIKYTTKSTCKRCGHVETSTSTKEETRERNICPRCYKETLTGEFKKHEIGSNNVIDAEYLEHCTSPGCGYSMIWTLHQSLGSAPALISPRQKPSGPSRADIAVANINFNDPSSLSSIGFSGYGTDCWYWSSNDGCRHGADRKPCSYEWGQVNCPYFSPSENFKSKVKERVRSNNTPIGRGW